MKVIVTESYEEMSEQAFALVKEVVLRKKDAVLGLATGTTPLGLYACMIRDHRENGTSYKKVRTVNLDEYASLGADHEQSYAYFMKKNLFSALDIEPQNTNIENGTAEDFGAECKRYDALLNSLPRDLQVLGIGSNGHIAFNEPGTPFGSGTHAVRLAESTIRDNSRLFESEDEVPKMALTMGIKHIMQAKKIIILANGKNKADAVFKLVHGAVTEEFPASVLQLHPDCTLICDGEAAQLL